MNEDLLFNVFRVSIWNDEYSFVLGNGDGYTLSAISATVLYN